MWARFKGRERERDCRLYLCRINFHEIRCSGRAFLARLDASRVSGSLSLGEFRPESRAEGSETRPKIIREIFRDARAGRSSALERVIVGNVQAKRDCYIYRFKEIYAEVAGD